MIHHHCKLMSETLIVSHLSESIDVPAGCLRADGAYLKISIAKFWISDICCLFFGFIFARCILVLKRRVKETKERRNQSVEHWFTLEIGRIKGAGGSIGPEEFLSFTTFDYSSLVSASHWSIYLSNFNLCFAGVCSQWWVQDFSGLVRQLRARSHLTTTMCFSVVMFEQLYWWPCNLSLATCWHQQKSVSLLTTLPSG